MQFKITLVSIFLFVFSSCKQESAVELSEVGQFDEEVTPEVKKYDALIALFKEFSEDTLYVTSTWETDADWYQFKGVKLTKEFVLLLPHAFAEEYEYNEEFSATYRIELDEKRTGIVVRTPGEYSPTNLHLFIIDKELDSITSSISMADVFGDAGDTYNYASCLFRDKRNKWNVLTGSYSSFQEIDDTLLEESFNYSLNTLNKGKFELVTKDSAQLVSKYAVMLDNLFGNEEDLTLANSKRLTFESIPKSAQKTIIHETLQLWKDNGRIEGRGTGYFMMGGPQWWYSLHGVLKKDSLLYVNVFYEWSEGKPFSTKEVWVFHAEKSALRTRKLIPTEFRADGSGKYMLIEEADVHPNTMEQLTSGNAK